ncbi:MAG: hypothetical protein FJ137_01390 [Deltaproteobacteria bacterium]|nr:hypothetical protein [Deltaproteobacteria bacterium]
MSISRCVPGVALCLLAACGEPAGDVVVRWQDRDAGADVVAPVADAGEALDPVIDAGAPDAVDAGEPDVVDAGEPDVVDAGEPDVVDAGEADAGEPATPLRVAVISDLNGSYGATTYGSPVHAAVDALVADPPDLVLVTGDMVAGQQAGLDYAGMWRGFHDAVTEPLTAAGIPVAVTPGNHDASGYSGFGAERDEYARQWRARVPAVEFVDDDDYPFRYAFRAGRALFVSLDDTLVGPLAFEQRAWLDDVLRTDDPVKVVFGHVPLHPFTIGRETEILADDDLEDVMVARGVDVFVSGHHHGYFPGVHGALRVVSMACLGGGPRALVGTSSPSPRSLVRFVVDDAGLRALDAFGGSTFDTIVLRSSLPSSLGSGATLVRRDDL